MALVAKSPEARSSQWKPPTVTRRPQNGGLSPTSLASSNTRPSKRLLPNFTLVLAPLCLLHPSSSITGWRQRCSSDGPASDKSRTKPNLSLIVTAFRCFTSQAGWWASLGWAGLVARPRLWSLSFPSSLAFLPVPYKEPHTSQHSHLRVEWLTPLAFVKEPPKPR